MLNKVLWQKATKLRLVRRTSELRQPPQPLNARPKSAVLTPVPSQRVRHKLLQPRVRKGQHHVSEQRVPQVQKKHPQLPVKRNAYLPNQLLACTRHKKPFQVATKLVHYDVPKFPRHPVRFASQQRHCMRQKAVYHPHQLLRLRLARRQVPTPRTPTLAYQNYQVVP